VVRYRQLFRPGHDQRRGTGDHLQECGRNAQEQGSQGQRFLGVSPGNGKALGLDEKFAYNIVKQVGNYGEVFESNVGVNTPLGIERGLERAMDRRRADVFAAVQVSSDRTRRPLHVPAGGVIHSNT
jgi:hypothetical protein